VLSSNYITLPFDWHVVYDCRQENSLFALAKVYYLSGSEAGAAREK